MRMPLDDQQVSRHAMGQMADQLGILHDELVRAGFTGPLLDALVTAWWQATVTASMAPNLSEIMQGLIDTTKEEDDA